jgi:DNA-binding NtrC family response regulator
MDRDNTVLVVDDQSEIVNLVKTILYMEGYTVIFGCSGEDALYISEKHPFPIHLLLTDIRMGEMSGCDLAHTMRIFRPETKVMYMSAFADDDRVIQEIRAGIAGFLTKPFSAKKLLLKVEEVLSAKTLPHS